MNSQQPEKTIGNDGRIKYIVNIDGKRKTIDRIGQVKKLKSDGYLVGVNIESFIFGRRKVTSYTTITEDISQQECNSSSSECGQQVENIAPTAKAGNIEDTSHFLPTETIQQKKDDLEKEKFSAYSEKNKEKLSRESEKVKISLQHLQIPQIPIDHTQIFKGLLKKLQTFHSNCVNQICDFKVSDVDRNELSQLLNNNDASQFFVKILHMDPMQKLFQAQVNTEIQTVTLVNKKSGVFNDFPPNFSESYLEKITNAMVDLAPNLTKTLLTLCCEPGKPLTEQEFKKVTVSFLSLCNLQSYRLDSFSKILSSELKLCRLTNEGVDVLSELGFVQSSRSLMRNRDFLAGINRQHMIDILSKGSFDLSLDNLDKTVLEKLEHFTSGLAIPERVSSEHLSTKLPNIDPLDLFKLDFLCLKNTPELYSLYQEAAVHIIGQKIAELGKEFQWITGVLGVYKHELSGVSQKVSKSYNAFMLNLHETNNADCVSILDHCVDLFVECLLVTCPELAVDIQTLKNLKSSEKDCQEAGERVLKEAESFGLPIVFGDLLTYERFLNAIKLRRGSVTVLELFVLLKFEISIFHMKMAKLNVNFVQLMSDLSNTTDVCTLSYIRAKLFKTNITNVPSIIKKDGNHERHYQFFTSCGEGALRSALQQYFVDGSVDLSSTPKSLEGVSMLVQNFLTDNGIHLFYDPSQVEREPYDDLHSYSTRLVTCYIIHLQHDFLSKSGHGKALRAVRRASILEFLGQAGQRSKYAQKLLISEINYHCSSDREKFRNDIGSTVNVWGGSMSSVDIDKHQEHWIKRIQSTIDNLHGHFDAQHIETAIQSLDLEIKISDKFRDEFQLGHKHASHSTKYMSCDEKDEIFQMFEDEKPFSTNRQKITFCNPVGSSPFVGLSTASISKFLLRNKNNFSRGQVDGTGNNDSDDETV